MTFGSQVQLPIGVQAVYPQQMRDPSNVFKDAVDELFQGAMVALNSSNDIVFPKNVSCIANWGASCLPPIDDGSSKCI